MSMETIGKELYDESATLGRLKSLIGAIVGTVIFIIILVISITMLKQKYTRTLKTRAIIINDPNCVPSVDKDNHTTYNCNFKIKYTSEKNISTEVTVTKEFSPIKYIKDQDIEIFYNPIDLTDVSLIEESSHLGALILLAIGILILFSSWIQYYIVKTSKLGAAGTGAASVVNMFRS